MDVLQGGVVSTSPNPQAGGPPLVGSPQLLIQFIRSYPPYRTAFLYPQPEDVPCLEFKLSKEENHITNYHDFIIQRKHSKVELNVYRKPTYIDIAIHFKSNHSYRHKMAGFYIYINRMNNIHDSQQTIKQEWDKIINMARNNGFPVHLIHSLRNRITKKRQYHIYTGKRV